MNAKRMNLFLVLLLLFSTHIGAQKTVSFAENEKVGTITTSKNFVGITALNKKKTPYKALLYDKAGNKLLEKSEFTNWPWIIVATPVEPLNYFIIVIHGGAEGPPPEEVKAYDINTGQEVWSTTTNAYAFRISPDGMHMVTESGAHDRRSPLEIISLRDGTKHTPFPEIHIYDSATWLDNERVLFSKRTWIDNPEYIIQQKLRREEKKRLHELRRPISIQLAKLHIELKKGEISEEEYQQQRSKLIADLKEIDLARTPKPRRTESGRKVSGRIPSSFPHGTKLFVYNILSNTVEFEKEVKTQEGEPVIVLGPLYVNDDKEIISTCLLPVSDPGDQVGHLIKLDGNLETSWVTDFSGLRSIITVDNQAYLRITKNGKTSMIVNDTGEILSLEKMLEENVALQSVDRNLLTAKLIKRFHTDISFSKVDNTVIFKKKGNLE